MPRTIGLICLCGMLGSIAAWLSHDVWLARVPLIGNVVFWIVLGCVLCAYVTMLIDLRRRRDIDRAARRNWSREMDYGVWGVLVPFIYLIFNSQRAAAAASGRERRLRAPGKKTRHRRERSH